MADVSRARWVASALWAGTTGCGQLLGIVDFGPGQDASSDMSPSQVKDAAAEAGEPDEDSGSQVEDAGTDASADAGTAVADAAQAEAGAPDASEQDAAGPSAMCMASATRCAGRAVETCGADGTWGAPVACSASQR
ncbi:MAG TPA: hypothetical protein VFZ61_26060, partial [Polyangiales bacterium]